VSTHPPGYDPSKRPPYIPPEARRPTAPPTPEGPRFAPLSPEQAQAAFAELVDPFAPVVSGQAIASFLIAIICATLLPILAQVLSIYLGARALKRIKRSDGAIVGRGLALFGIIFSCLCLAGYLTLIALIIYGTLSFGALLTSR
jgi:hypothetical protein